MCMLGVHFVPISHPFICKKFVQLNIKLFNVNIDFRKLMITFVGRFFCSIYFISIRFSWAIRCFLIQICFIKLSISFTDAAINIYFLGLDESLGLI